MPFQRAQMLERLRTEEFDVLVVGGGITGAGVALDAASRGLRTALVERDDFASGTSSKSSKLIHGGLRYLQQGDVRLVYEALRERQRLLRNAPHLVSVLPFLLPVLVKNGPVSKRIAKALRSALWMYDLTGGWRIGRRHRKLDAVEALAHCPTMPADRLSSAFLYYDAAADDARLTLAVARTAAAHGAAVANRAGVVDIVTSDDLVNGAVVEADGERITVRARAVVSAAGVWADQVRSLDEGHDPGSIRPAKGVHLNVPWQLVRNSVAVIISAPSDRRSLFLVPWGPAGDGTFQYCYIGTTDTEFDGDVDQPQTADADIDYVLAAVNDNLTTTITRDDVLAVWAGLRPLGTDDPDERTTDLSRRHRVTISDTGLITVTGGKLTTYREMAQHTVDEVMAHIGDRARCRTKRLPLVGSSAPPSNVARHLARRFGSEAAGVQELIDADPSLGEPLVPGLVYLKAEAVWAAREEMALTLIDVLARRTRAHIQDRAACLAASSDVAELLATELGWDDDEVTRQIEGYSSLCQAELAAATPTTSA